uniref:Uncharacterized protein n=1 Tax=Trichuris muris TaxID=70415 RepID=A0A5S6R350_TRIMR
MKFVEIVVEVRSDVPLLTKYVAGGTTSRCRPTVARAPQPFPLADPYRLASWTRKVPPARAAFCVNGSLDVRLLVLLGLLAAGFHQKEK